VATQAGSLLATHRGKLTLLLLCAVQFLYITAATTRQPELPRP
jgi:hypothetical protein